MQINYLYIKKILTAIRECDSHTISTEALIDILKTPDNKQELDKFFGHLLFLADNRCIDEVFNSARYRFGIVYDNNGFNSYGDTLIRLTASGYDFLDILNQDKVLQKIKGFGFTAAVEVGKLLLQKAIL